MILKVFKTPPAIIKIISPGLQGPPGPAGGPQGPAGRDPEFQNNGTHIQWRYVGDTVWIDLVALTEIKGDQGDQGLPGTDGTPVELRVFGNMLQWRLQGSGDPWQDLYDVTAIGVPQWVEVEIDFGTVPVTDKQFVVAAVGASPASKLVVVPCGKPATGRTSDDWQWDSITLAAVPGTDVFTLYASCASGSIVGPRKIQYQLS